VAILPNGPSVQNMPSAKLIPYPDANHGSWYQNHEDLVFETHRFLSASDGIVSVVANAAADVWQWGGALNNDRSALVRRNWEGL
jgi:hypothetical protein